MSVYRDLVRQVNGGVEILGDPAVRVDETPSGVEIRYKDTVYTKAEQINVGLGGRFRVAAAPTPDESFVTAIPSPNIDLPFIAQKLTVPSNVALYFMLTFAQVSSVTLIDGDAVCMDLFSEVSLNNAVRWPTAQTGQSIKLQVGNTDMAAHEPRVSLTGVRLRP